MIKKLLLSSIMFGFFYSCDRVEDNDVVSSADAGNKIEKVQKKSQAFSVQAISNSSLKCGEGSSVSLDLNPTLPYYDDFNVSKYDNVNNCPSNNKQCLSISAFLLRKGAYISGSSSAESIQRFGQFSGYDEINEFNAFKIDEVPLETVEFTMGDDPSTGYGLWADGVASRYMTNNNANAVLHYFKNNMKGIHSPTGAPIRIAAVHIYRESLLCIPSYAFIRMSVKYY